LVELVETLGWLSVANPRLVEFVKTLGRLSVSKLSM